MTAVQLSIVWVLRPPGVICALTGPTSIAHLEEKVVAGTVELPEETLQAVETLISRTNQRLQQQQAESVERIVTTPLPADPEGAFVDLIYAIETSISLGLVGEVGFYRCFRSSLLRQNLHDSGSALEDLRGRLEEIIESAF